MEAMSHAQRRGKTTPNAPHPQSPTLALKLFAVWQSDIRVLGLGGLGRDGGREQHQAVWLGQGNEEAQKVQWRTQIYFGICFLTWIASQQRSHSQLANHPEPPVLSTEAPEQGSRGVSGDKRQDLVTQGAASRLGPLLPGIEHGGMCGVQRGVGNQRFPLVLSQPLAGSLGRTWGGWYRQPT